MRNYFSWLESQHNAFANYTQYLEQQSAADSMPQPALTLPQWKDFTRDSDSKFDKVRFGAAPLADSSMSRVSAADFKTRPEANLQSFGANIERLPTPSQQNGTSSTVESSPEP